MADLTVYGADWCNDTSHTRERLDALGIPYEYVNVDDDVEGTEFVLIHNAGMRKLPTVDVAGLVLAIPDDDELESALSDRGLIGDVPPT